MSTIYFKGITTIGLLLVSVHSLNAQNLPKTSMNFTNVTATKINQTVAETTTNEKEVEIGDFDNDGDPDVAIAVARSDFTDRKNKLYRNDGGVFNEVSGTSIIPNFSFANVTRNAKFRDYDLDGWLDLVMVSDSNNGPQGVSHYYRNVHPGGVFSHFVQETARLNGAAGATCSAEAADFDNNGTQDLYFGNYPFNSQDTMYFNDGTADFTDMTSNNVPVELDYTVDISCADFNNDGKIDLCVTSHFDPTYIVYNDNLNAGSGVGDFKYTGSRQSFGGNTNEPAMEPGDFDLDGDMDIYYSNRVGNSDRIFRNDGLDGANKAIFTELTVPGPGNTEESRKCTVGDLNRDGRLDLLVMSESGRPRILRNTTVNGQMSFIPWTPAPAFPNGNTHRGWHAAVFDANQDLANDILIGGRDDDHLFYNKPSRNVKFQPVLPDVHNLEPITVHIDAAAGQTITMTTTNIPSGASVSVVADACGDITLEIRDSGGGLVASSERGGIGIEEATHFTAPGGELSFELTMNAICGSSDFGRPSGSVKKGQKSIKKGNSSFKGGGPQERFYVEILSRD